MSAGYAQRLKDYPNKGVCGLPEIYDTTRALTVKINRLAELVNHSKSIVIVTGAGISTSCGIPDFRGPNGIWTLEKQQQQQEQKRKRRKDKENAILLSNKQQRRRLEKGGEAVIRSNDLDSNSNHSWNHKAIDAKNNTIVQTTTTTSSPPPSVDFTTAKPSLAHYAISYLVNNDTKNRFKHVITQNIDGLHQRTGLSRNYLSVLHGCAFTEKCNKCHTEYYRDYDIGGISFQPTGRYCTVCTSTSGTGGVLCDTLLDWDDPLPEDDLHRATVICENADLVISIGTSLRIEPAGSLPTLARKYVIINLQETAKDSQATLLIRSDINNVITRLMDQLGYEFTDWYKPNDPVQIERQWKFTKSLKFPSKTKSAVKTKRSKTKELPS